MSKQKFKTSDRVLEDLDRRLLCEQEKLDRVLDFLGLPVETDGLSDIEELILATRHPVIC